MKGKDWTEIIHTLDTDDIKKYIEAYKTLKNWEVFNREFQLSTFPSVLILLEEELIKREH